MRGNFELNENQYPITVQFRGIDSVIITDLLTDEDHGEAEVLLGTYGSAARIDQYNRLYEKCRLLNQARREASRATLPAGVSRPQAGATSATPVRLTDASQLGTENTTYPGVTDSEVLDGGSGEELHSGSVLDGYLNE